MAPQINPWGQTFGPLHMKNRPGLPVYKGHSVPKEEIRSGFVIVQSNVDQHYDVGPLCLISDYKVEIIHYKVVLIKKL